MPCNVPYHTILSNGHIVACLLQYTTLDVSTDIFSIHHKIAVDNVCTDTLYLTVSGLVDHRKQNTAYDRAEKCRFAVPWHTLRVSL